VAADRHSYQAAKWTHYCPVEPETPTTRHIRTLDPRFGRQTRTGLLLTERKIPYRLCITGHVKAFKSLRIDLFQITLRHPKSANKAEQYLGVERFAQNLKPRFS
jgi:hypothetical protein